MDTRSRSLKSHGEVLVTSPADGIAASVQPAGRETMIVTSTEGLECGEARIPARDGAEISAYFAVPQPAGRYATILVIPEIWGVHEYTRDVARRLAKAGVFALVVDPYTRLGDLTRLKEVAEVMACANQLTDEEAFADLDAAVAWAGTQPKADIGRLGITGFCRGGRMTWMYTAHNPGVRAGVAWYGGLDANLPAQPRTPADIAGQLHAPVLGLYGGADPSIPRAAVERLNDALRAAGRERESRIHLYPDAPHAFHADYRSSYRREAAEDGWIRMLAWFSRHGVV